MNYAFVLVVTVSILFGLQNNSCDNKRGTASTATPAASAMPSKAMTPDPALDKHNAGGKQPPAGFWGGLHVTLELTAQGATLEFDCATGNINQPILLDSADRFEVNGSYSRQGPGPVRQGGQSDAEATYSGTVAGETMNLTVRVKGLSEPLNFSLTHGREGKIQKCY